MTDGFRHNLKSRMRAAKELALREPTADHRTNYGQTIMDWWAADEMPKTNVLIEQMARQIELKRRASISGA
jgi:hypothetical protein